MGTIDDVSIIDLNGMGLTQLTDLEKTQLLNFDKTKGI